MGDNTYIYNDGMILTPVIITILGNKTVNNYGESMVLFANITTDDGASVAGKVLTFKITMRNTHHMVKVMEIILTHIRQVVQVNF